jgi:hypothetical protein
LYPFQVVGEGAQIKSRVSGSAVGWLKADTDEILSDAFNIISTMEVNL